jgi:hypothetical protein
MERAPGDASDADRHEAVAHLEPAGFALDGRVARRKRSKWRCPTSECEPKSVWLRADPRNPLIPRGTDRCRTCIGGEVGPRERPAAVRLVRQPQLRR